jgi:hypothetical protein
LIEAVAGAVLGAASAGLLVAGACLLVAGDWGRAAGSAPRLFEVTAKANAAAVQNRMRI